MDNSRQALDFTINNLPLSELSLAWVVGAWSGKVIEWIAERYHCWIMGFEPQIAAYDQLVRAHYPNTDIFRFGLGDKAGIFPMCKVGTDGCSFLTDPLAGQLGKGEMVNVADFIRAYRIGEVDFSVINCEGYEFFLLPYLMETELIRLFNYLMVQFHPEWSGGVAMPSIIDRMRVTHKPIGGEWEGSWRLWERI